MAARTQDASDYYVWSVPGKPVAVHLHLDVVDRILAEAMRGFGAVPKRGAEVGGLLIGSIQTGNEPGSVSIVRIEDFEPVECSYKRGPSFLFTDEDRAVFESALARYADSARPAYAVGFYRSSTREGMSLEPEDLELMGRFFPLPANVALLIKPYGTKVSIGGFFFRENGAFQEATPLEFPFRRRELTGEEAPPPRSMMERKPRSRGQRPLVPPVMTTPAEAAGGAGYDPYSAPDETFDQARQPGPAYAVTLPSRSRFRSAVWLPLSFVFLLFGIAIGLMIALTGMPGTSRVDAQEFSLGLAVSRSDDNLSVKWDRQAPAIRAAQRGVLEIEEGGNTKPVDLDTAQLRNPNFLYHNNSNTVRFRLIVYPRDGVSVAETLNWKR
jgi:hypothetical protein